MKFGPNMPLGKRKMPAKFGHDRPPDGELWDLKVPLGPTFGKGCRLRPTGFADLILFLAGTYHWTTVPARYSGGPRYFRGSAIPGRVRVTRVLLLNAGWDCNYLGLGLG